jgi:hypothetical protein
VSNEISEVRRLLESAIESHRHARELQNDALEGVEHIRTLAEQALREPPLSRKLLAEIAATAQNTVRSLDDAIATFSGARVSATKAKELIRRTASAEQTEDTL